MSDDDIIPYAFRPDGSNDLSAFTTAAGGVIAERLSRYGVVLFRGFNVRCLQDFDQFVTALAAERLDYEQASTPRTRIGDRIFTATEYPADREIPLHSEHAYQREWPMKLALCCLTPAAVHGETSLADLRDVTAAIGGELMDKLEERAVKYVRHYRPHVDIPWQRAFRTENRTEVERFCASHDISCEWIDHDMLMTSQVSQGTAIHPSTGERMFFNQAHLFHVSSLGTEAATAMLQIFGPDRLPRHAYYGNGEDIPTEDLATIRTSLAKCAKRFRWAAGDVVLLDNMRYAHGRLPYIGRREVLVSLIERYHP